MRQFSLVAVLATFLIAPAKAHIPVQCNPHGKALGELLTKKYEMIRNLPLEELRLTLESARESAQAGEIDKEDAWLEPDPTVLLQLHKEVVTLEVDRVLPALTRWVKCLKESEDAPEIEDAPSLDLWRLPGWWHLPNYEDLPPLDPEYEPSEFAKRQYELLMDAAGIDLEHGFEDAPGIEVENLPPLEDVR